MVIRIVSRFFKVSITKRVIVYDDGSPSIILLGHYSFGLFIIHKFMQEFRIFNILQVISKSTDNSPRQMNKFDHSLPGEVEMFIWLRHF